MALAGDMTPERCSIFAMARSVTARASTPPPGYPDSAPRGPAVGDLHRVTAMGPGVTPDVQWEGAPLGPYNLEQDTAYDTLFDSLVGTDDRVCTNER